MFFCVLGEYKKITSYRLDGCVPGCKETESSRGRTIKIEEFYNKDTKWNQH